MVRFDVELSPKLDRQFRSTVMKRMGMKKGNLSLAIQQSIKLWLRYDGREVPTTTPKVKQTPELVASASTS